MAGQKGFDLIEAYAAPLPVIVIAEMLGIDPADRDHFKRWSDLTGMILNPRLSEEQRALMVESGARRLSPPCDLGTARQTHH